MRGITALPSRTPAAASPNGSDSTTAADEAFGAVIAAAIGILPAPASPTADAASSAPPRTTTSTDAARPTRAADSTGPAGPHHDTSTADSTATDSTAAHSTAAHSTAADSAANTAVSGPDDAASTPQPPAVSTAAPVASTAAPTASAPGTTTGAAPSASALTVASAALRAALAEAGHAPAAAPTAAAAGGPAATTPTAAVAGGPQTQPAALGATLPAAPTAPTRTPAQAAAGSATVATPANPPTARLAAAAAPARTPATSAQPSDGTLAGGVAASPLPASTADLSGKHGGTADGDGSGEKHDAPATTASAPPVVATGFTTALQTAVPTTKADAAPPAPAAPPVPVNDQVVRLVAPLQSAPDGNYSLSLQLHPADLGAVTVHVEVTQGVLSVHLVPDQDHAHDLLTNSLNDLRSQLATGGVRTADVSVVSRQQAGQQAGQHGLTYQQGSSQNWNQQAAQQFGRGGGQLPQRDQNPGWTPSAPDTAQPIGGGRAADGAVSGRTTAGAADGALDVLM